MKEQDLIDLKFERFDVSKEESGDEAYYFYEYKYGMISNANDELVNGEWEVDFNDVIITDVNDLKLLIDVLERGKSIPLQHKAKALTKEEVEANRSNAYKYFDI